MENIEKLPQELPVTWNGQLLGYTLDMDGCIRVVDKELWEKLLKETPPTGIYVSSRSIGEVKKDENGIDFVYCEERKEFCVLTPIIK